MQSIKREGCERSHNQLFSTENPLKSKVLPELMKDSLSSLAMVTLTVSCGPILTLCTNAALISNECKITVNRLLECLHVHMYVHVPLIIIILRLLEKGCLYTTCMVQHILCMLCSLCRECAQNVWNVHKVNGHARNKHELVQTCMKNA